MTEPKIWVLGYKLKESNTIVFDKNHVANTNPEDFEEVSVYVSPSWIKKMAMMIEEEEE